MLARKENNPLLQIRLMDLCDIMKLEMMFYIFWKWICFHCKRHPYMAIWTISNVMLGIVNAVMKTDISILVGGCLYGVLPWFLYRGYRIFNRHGIRDKVQRHLEFEKYIKQELTTKKPKWLD